MLTMREVADRYGVSVGFMLRALARIRYRGAKPEQPLSAATVARFEKEWGTKIRAARPKPPPAFRGETDVAPSSARSARQPKPSLRDLHDGPHRARDGAEWETGVDDYVPAPDEVGSRVTEAS